jgi:NAD(P)-dependent dehydrogenase (short-subunit alcohol dehydrogenase family)
LPCPQTRLAPASIARLFVSSFFVSSFLRFFVYFFVASFGTYCIRPECRPSLHATDAGRTQVLDVNLKACWLLAQAAGRHMLPRRRGKIINLCSLLTYQVRLPSPIGRLSAPRRRRWRALAPQGGLTVPAYAAAKGALGQLTKALSNEWARENVQVNGIAPGYIATDMCARLLLPLFSSCWRSHPHSFLPPPAQTGSTMTQTRPSALIPHRNERLLADPVRLRQISERIPAGRWGAPQDFAGPVVFLASAASQYVSGELLVVDGGWMGRWAAARHAVGGFRSEKE